MDINFGAKSKLTLLFTGLTKGEIANFYCFKMLMNEPSVKVSEICFFQTVETEKR